jgi:hypothetical protein
MILTIEKDGYKYLIDPRVSMYSYETALIANPENEGQLNCDKLYAVVATNDPRYNNVTRLKP